MSKATWYAWALSWLLVVSVAILIIPVSLQIFSRYTELIPSYIWTEEMARFFFIQDPDGYKIEVLQRHGRYQ